MAGMTILVLAMLLGFISPADDSFSGTWVLNVSKSKNPPPLTAPKSIIADVAVNTSDIEITEKTVTDSGGRLTIHAIVKFDGKDYPITGTLLADAVAYQHVDRNTIKGTAKKGGKVVQQQATVVSPDGKKMTGTYSISDASGN